ncbi:MAG: hypothetical protein OXF09_07965 [Hyphomicrobiales bacterium]|nr:hypothetical protein [Hyphomicrobiales bacterium]
MEYVAPNGGNVIYGARYNSLSAPNNTPNDENYQRNKQFGQIE